MANLLWHRRRHQFVIYLFGLFISHLLYSGPSIPSTRLLSWNRVELWGAAYPEVQTVTVAGQDRSPQGRSKNIPYAHATCAASPIRRHQYGMTSTGTIGARSDPGTNLVRHPAGLGHRLQSSGGAREKVEACCNKGFPQSQCPVRLRQPASRPNPLTSCALSDAVELNTPNKTPCFL